MMHVVTTDAPIINVNEYFTYHENDRIITNLISRVSRIRRPDKGSYKG